MNQEMAMVVRNNEEREALKNVITQWNANRLDLFELSLPDQNLEFHGVMRFYFQDSGQKVATKCIRVASNATTQVVIETLIEKFRPDMRMLSIPEYALYEIHENGGNEERRLEPDEKPLLVQLDWHSDDREGRFLLRRIDDTTNMPETFQEGSSFKRKLSKREKKQLKKQEKLNRMKNAPVSPNDENDSGVAEKLYTELPETSFTRSISNPEAVMRRRRQQQLEQKLQEFRSKGGGPDTGGTLKIYGEALCRDVPYKTLLLSIGDTAAQVVREMLNKYGLDKEEPHHYCLVQVNTAIEETKDNGLGNNNTINNREYILDDDECPLAILMKHPATRGSIMFHVRRRPADYLPRKRKKKPQQGKWSHNELMDRRYDDGVDRLPFFLELNPDGSEIAGGTAKRYRLQPNVTEVGSERVSPHGHGQSLQLFGPNIQPRHCVIAHTEGIVTVTPCSRDAETYVNGQRIYETTILQHGASVKFGRIHNFRFLDPCHDERLRQRHDSSRSPQEYSYDRQSTREETSSLSVGNGPTSASTPSGNPLNYETTFDVDGNVETRSTSSQGNKDDTRSQRSISSSREGNRLSNYDRYPRGTDPILPAVLEIREETEEALLHAIITDLDPTAPSFKLAPAFTLYLIARYRASTHYRPELTPTERAHRLTLMLARVAGMIHNVIQERYCEVKCLAMWLANASELLHFLKCDRHISAFSLDAQDTLADAVQIAFRHLVACFQGELSAVMPNFLSDRDDLSHDPEDSSTASVLGVLSSAMTFLRRCRVNAALTIQLFSQLFYYINVWAFNRVVAPNSIYCSRAWGLRLKARLAQIEVWAESQGLELAADCHLARITQAAHLLQAPKYTCEDLAALSNTYFKLNSLQLRALLQKYQPTPDEPRISHEVVDNVARVAENLADELARSDGREVRLEEDPELAVPFLLPEDGYSCEVTRGVPPGLVDFIAPLQHAGLCRLTSQPTSNGLWTVYMGPINSMIRSPSAMSNRSAGFVPTQQEPEIQTIKLVKSNNGIGLSIVAAKGAGQDRLGIYIKSVVKGGAADADGRLQAGDQLLKVDGQSLVGITQEKGAEYLVRTGPVVTLEVAKQGAIFHGLATLLSQPSPVMARASRAQLPSAVMDRPGLPHSYSYSSVASPSSYSSRFNNYREQLPLPPPRPGSPTVLRLSVPIITTTPPPLPMASTSATIPPDQLLSVPTTSRVHCYKVPTVTANDLHRDIFQEHQARLVNCDSEDASAFQRRTGDIVRDCSKNPETPPLWLNNSLSRIKECPKGKWYPINGSKSWKSDFYLNSSGQWEKLNKVDCTSYKQRSKSVADILDRLDSSSSECSCPEIASSGDSDSSKERPQAPQADDSKLSTEERLRTLRELDEIVRGIGRITDFAKQDLKPKESPKTTAEPKLYFREATDSSTPDSSDEGDFEYGTGRVAALAKHFSAMGEAGIIRGSGGRFTRSGGRLVRDRYRSEPNVSHRCDDVDDDDYGGLSPRPGDVILDESAFDCRKSDKYDLVLASPGLEPVGFSMDRLIDIGHKIVKREMKPKESVAVKVVIPELKKSDQEQQTSPNLDVELNRRSPVQITDTLRKKDPSVLKPKTKYPFLDPKRKSISVDEVEMRRKSQTKSPPPKHYSLVDLMENKTTEAAPVTPDPQGDAKPSTPIIDKPLRKWMSVDESHKSSVGGGGGGWAAKLEKDRLDFGSDRDTLRKKCGRADVIKSRKNKRLRKLEFQRTVIVTPVRVLSRNSSASTMADLGVGGGGGGAPLMFRSLDSLGECDYGPPSGAFGGGDESRPRRMSERDLPSRVLNEQQNPQGRSQYQPHPPQIHSSKSVPSLNTGNHDLERPVNMNQTVVGNSTMPRPNHEVFNPGYSRTSSTTSIPQKSYDGQPHPSQYQMRSRSNQNLADPRVSQGNVPTSNPHLMNHRPPHMNSNYPPHQPPYLGGEHPSPVQQQPTQRSQLMSPHHVMSPYHHQQQPPPPQQQQQQQQHQPPPQQYHPGGPPPPHPGAYQAQPPHLQPHLHQHPMQQQQNSPVGENGERFYQNLSIYRNQEPTLPNGYAPQPQNGMVRGKMPSPQDERTPVGAMQKNLRGSQSSLQSRTMPDVGNMSRDRPASAYLPNNTYHHPPTGGPLNAVQSGLQARSQSSRDMLRQEAKLQEMTEEVRRREARVTSPQQRPNMGPVGSPPIQGSPLRHPGGPPAGYPVDGYGNARVPPHQEYADSPPPPPPPPTTTHPLYQTQLRPDSRYTASGNEHPRGSYNNLSMSSQQQQQLQQQQQQGKEQMYYHGSNPWHKEEKEKEAERRRDVARHWRDEQIHQLTNLPHRNPQQEEHLRALKLEKEFERRAEELEEEEEEDQETAERVQGLLRVAHQNDERRSLRTPLPVSQHNAGGGSTQSILSQSNGTINRPAISSGGSIYSGASAEEKARLQRLKDLKMKQAEIEAERMKKKEEEVRSQGLQSVPAYQVTSRTNVSNSISSSSLRNTSTTSNLRLENLTINSPATGNNHYHNNNNGFSSNQPSPAGQRLDLMLGQQSSNGPPPPERGSSFAVMSQQSQGLRSPTTPTTPTSTTAVNNTSNSVLNNNINNVTPTATVATAKRVSFQDPPPPMPASPPPLDNIREDPNNFINEAETMLASPTTPETSFTGGTPGVIGAQEVYRDPRQRRLAEQQRQSQLSNKAGAVPEKLSFKEKMKMFAMETGEDATPKDKVKISRAQRDIDNLGGSLTNNNNNPTTPTSANAQSN